MRQHLFSTDRNKQVFDLRIVALVRIVVLGLAQQHVQAVYVTGADQVCRGGCDVCGDGESLVLKLVAQNIAQRPANLDCHEYAEQKQGSQYDAQHLGTDAHRTGDGPKPLECS